jgi:hypothetical protein
MMTSLVHDLIIAVATAGIGGLLYLAWFEYRGFVRLAMLVAVIGLFCTVIFAAWDGGTNYAAQALLPFIKPGKQAEAQEVIDGMRVYPVWFWVSIIVPA